jgi:hypothetical protein
MCTAELPSISEELHPKARVEHRCCECGRIIKKGEVYQKIKGCWDDEWQTYKTCLQCERLRDKLCDPHEGPAAFGYLAEQAAESETKMSWA